MSLAKHFDGRSEVDLWSLAKWPDTFVTDPDNGIKLARHVEPRDYMRVLLEVLLRRHQRVMIESTIVVYEDDVAYYECLARLRTRHHRFEVIAGGSTPQAARFNAELFAVRKAVLREDMPVLGRLLSQGRMQVDLVFYRDPVVGILGRWYGLDVREDQRDLPQSWCLDPPRLPKSEYPMMRVSIQDDNVNKRTRYLIVDNLHQDVKALVGPFMNTDGTIYLHRLLLALQGKPINDLKSLNDLRRGLELVPYEGDLLHGHHINAIGYDNRQENLQALTEKEHAKKHVVWIKSYNDIAQGMEYWREAEVKALLRPPPRVIVTPGHYDVQTIFDLEPYSAEGELLGRFLVGLQGDVYPMDLPIQVPLPNSVTNAEIKLVAGRSDRESNLLKVISSLVALGGQGKFSEIKNARSLRRVSENTVRNSLRSLEGAGVIHGTKVNPMTTSERGAEKHYRLARPLAPDLQRLIRRRDRNRKTSSEA